MNVHCPSIPSPEYRPTSTLPCRISWYQSIAIELIYFLRDFGPVGPCDFISSIWFSLKFFFFFWLLFSVSISEPHTLAIQHLVGIGQLFPEIDWNFLPWLWQLLKRRGIYERSVLLRAYCVGWWNCPLEVCLDMFKIAIWCPLVNDHMLNSKKKNSASKSRFLVWMAVELRIDNNLHQQLLALRVPIQQIKKTYCAPYSKIMLAGNMHSQCWFGRDVQF